MNDDEVHLTLKQKTWDELQQEHAYALDDAHAKGWEAARVYFKKQVLELLLKWRTSEDEFDIDEAFENPEDESEILRQAALNRGKP